MIKRNRWKLSVFIIFVCSITAFVYLRGYDENIQNSIEISNFIDSGILAINDRLNTGCNFEAFYNKCYAFELNNKKFYFITGKIIGNNHIPTISLLVDEKGNLIKELQTFNNVYILRTLSL